MKPQTILEWLAEVNRFLRVQGHEPVSAATVYRFYNEDRTPLWTARFVATRRNQPMRVITFPWKDSQGFRG